MRIPENRVCEILSAVSKIPEGKVAPEQRILGMQNRDFGADINFRVNLSL